MPSKLHAELAVRSEAAGVSLNQFIVSALTEAASGRQPAAAPRETSAAVPRSLRLALIANAVVVAIAAGTAIAVLAFGWH
jgi:HicB family